MPPYMRRGPHGYKFVRPVPVKLRATFEKSNFVQQLGKDFKKAKELCAELAVSTNEQIALARSGIASKDAQTQLLKHKQYKKLSITPELPKQIAALFLSGLEADAKARRDGLEDHEYDELSENIAKMLPVINRSLSTGQVDKFHPAIEQLVFFRGYHLNLNDIERQELTYNVLKYVKKSYEILAARQQGDQLESPVFPELPEPLSASWEINSESTPSKNIKCSDITPYFEKYLSSVEKKSRTTYISIWEKFVDYVNNKPAKNIIPSDIYNFMEARLNDDLEPWSQKYTHGRVKRTLSGAFEIAKINEFIDKNPVSDLSLLPTISKSEEAKRSRPRYPFKTHHLNSIFSSEWYNPDSKNWKGKLKYDLGARYWIPLICMWHGLRVGESSQIQVHDINLEESFIMIQISEEDDHVGPKRSIKNQESMRNVPIHPNLIKLGFIDFVKSVRTHYQKGPLFPCALPEIGGKTPEWGRSYKQAFNNFLVKTLGFGPGYRNHSFRHALEDRIRAAKAEEVWPEGLSRQFTGRASSSSREKAEEGSEQHYGDGYAMDALLRYASKITYPDVISPQPFKIWLGNRSAVSENLIAFARSWAN